MWRFTNAAQLVRPMISFSTCWNSARHTTGDAMLREIKAKLGFELIELDRGVRSSLVPGIQKVLDAAEIRFSSLHDFCNLSNKTPVFSPHSYRFSAESAEDRERAVTQAFQAIDLAAQLN